MRIKEIYVEAKKSKNYQTYTVGMTADVSDDDRDRSEIVRKIQTKCRKLCQEQLELD